MSARIGVVIPMYNHHEMTHRCIEDTFKNAGTDVHIVVVDDGSESPFICYKNDVKVLRLEKNSGYTKAANEGMLWCLDKYKYIHMQNNDIVPHKNYIRIIEQGMGAREEVGIGVSLRLISHEGKPVYEICGADLLTGYQRVTESEKLPEIFNVHWAPICSALVSTKMAKYIGILDESMRMWSSDLEYCIRANENDWNVFVYTKSVVSHVHSASTSLIKDKTDMLNLDHDALLRRMTNYYWAKIMRELPLDANKNIYGKLGFSTHEKK